MKIGSFQRVIGLALALALAVLVNAVAAQSNPLLSGGGSDSEESSASAQAAEEDLQHLVDVLRDEEKREELIRRLEVANGAGDAQADDAHVGEGSTRPLSDSLWQNMGEMATKAAAAVRRTFTSWPAFARFLERVGSSIFFLLAVYGLWCLLKRFLLPRLSSQTPAKIFGAIVLALVAAAFAAWEAINRVLTHRLLGLAAGDNALHRRIQTVIPLLRNALLVIICVITVLVVLSEVGIDIAPLLAGAGIAGLAIGFGAQQLIKDLLTGLFVLLENQINVGDWVLLGGEGGQVEKIRIRNVSIRDIYGNLHTIPWSSVVCVTNQTRTFGFAVVEVGVAYRENIDEVVEVVKQVSAEMREDPELSQGIQSDLQVLGLIELGDSSVVVRTRFKTAPFLRWRLERDFRRRIKNRFDELGIEIPYPHQTVYFGQDKQGNAPPVRVHIPEAPSEI